MQHYFVNEKIDNYFIFDKETSHHLNNVMRIKNNENLICVYEEEFYLCSIEVNNKDLKANIINKLDVNNELNCHINLIYGIPKGEKLDLVIQKATELGVKEITLFNSERSIVRYDESKIKSKLERFNKIIKGAAEQSKRNIIPTLNKPINIDKVPVNDINIIAYEEESSNTQKTLFNLLNKDLNNKVINVVIGPEGGFSEKEVNYLVNKGYVRVSLGKRILRSETACLDIISKISFMSEKE